MSLPLIPTLALSALLLTLFYKYIVHPTFLSPLSRIPNAHWSSPISSLYILSHRLAQTDTPHIHHLHTLYGPVIRLAPSEISVNCVDGGLRTVYLKGMEKGTWYKNVFSNYGVEPMFAMSGHGEHSRRKRMVSGVYARSALSGSASLTKQTEILVGELRERVRNEIQEDEKCGGKGIEFYDIFCAVTMDFVAGYVFGLKNGTKFVSEEKEEGIQLFHDFKARQKFTFYPQELPGLTRFLDKMGLKWLIVPSWVGEANVGLEDWLMGLVERARETRKIMDRDGLNKVAVEDVPTVYVQLEKALVKEKLKDDEAKGLTEKDRKYEDVVDDLKLEIASELLDHTLAGFDTSSITLTWLAWELSKPANATWQKLLRAEISALKGSLDAKAIDSLAILHAILLETLRLHAAIPGQQPRITPEGYSTILGDPEMGTAYPNIPPGVRVQAHAYSLHRIPSVFPSPGSWLPERWLDPLDPSSDPSNPSSYRLRSLDDPKKIEMLRHFWAFGSGGRMCVGSNLAILDMKATMVGLWENFETEIVNDEGMVPNGGYMAEPLGVGTGGEKGIGGKYAVDGEGRKFLRVRVREVEG
ncbi:hypothetical protein CKM354_000830200 [Cercospora kikuchii]|uniref:Cytochrome P450 n=1 Tax=Cercospora kikuchii TaxID=84275 RepID=A0A9P3FJC5_9PEZI|nr:uncharacterized protein CKM354_000830200 [Cercospora kikuchii]GIZ45119.1 hypothetical protein CKM354_000830200 [Cercospora kikuchii]